MSEFFFVFGDKDEGPAEVYASVVANDGTAATEMLRSEIVNLMGDNPGIEIPVENDLVTRLLVGINTHRISDDDIVMVDDEHRLQWDGEEISETEVASPIEYTESREIAELDELPSDDKFRQVIRERQNLWERKQARGLQFGIAKKGGVSIYGLNRYPVTLYYEQWIKILDIADDLRRFLEENKSLLKRKN